MRAWLHGMRRPRKRLREGAGEKRNRRRTPEALGRTAAHTAFYRQEIRLRQANGLRGKLDWLNHVQFSPTDPSLIMFCHEVPGTKVDRIWTIRSDGSGLQKLHAAPWTWGADTEFFAPDGKTMLNCDLQTPQGEDPTGWPAASGERTDVQGRPGPVVGAL